jgi:WD40 repeat protein/energy-coupling factor transporter ATP-binding protein EcfA2
MCDFPYPGLRPFKRDESNIFFGRQEHTDQLIDRLTEAHFIAVVGPSGCGKSSLVRTGLLAKLADDIDSAEMLSWQWRVTEMRPGDHPFQELATRFLEEMALEFSSPPTPTELQAMLRRGPLSFHEILDDHPLPDDIALLLVIDQFEELFRPFKDTNPKSPDSKNEAMAFVKLLLTGSQHPLVYVVITMRSDYIGDSAIFAGLPEAINQGIFVVPRLNRTQLQEVIEQPARKFNGEIEPILVNHLLNEMRNDPDQLPVLQHALMRMWKLAEIDSLSGKIFVSEKHYEQIGELDHALSKHAHEIYNSLSSSQQAIAEVLFRLLSDYKPDQRDIRRPVKLSEVAELAGVTCEEVKTVVENFRQPGRNFLMPPFPTKLEPDTTLEISHESFIRGWDKLKGWAKEEYDFAEEYRRLADLAVWSQGKAELLRGSALARFIDWRNRAKPTPAWAKRYGRDFERTIEFLEKSEEEQKKELQQQEERRQRELKQQQRELKQQQRELKQFKKLLALAVFVVFIFAIIIGWGFSERTKAIRAKTDTDRAVLKLFDSQLSHARDAIHQEDYQTALNLLKDSEGLTTIPPSRRQIRNLLAGFSHLMGGSPQQEVYKTDVPLADLAISADGKFLATAGENGTLVLLETNTGKVLSSLEGHTGKVHSVVFDPQGRWLASAGEDNKIILWSLPTGSRLKEWPAPAEVTALAVSPNGQDLFSGGVDNNITWWKVETGQTDSRSPLMGHSERISYLACSPDGKWLASASYDNTAKLWPVKTGQLSPLSLTEKIFGNVRHVVFSPDSKYVATSSDDKTIQLWEVESGESFGVLKGHQNKVIGLSFLADDNYLVSASQDRTLRIWEIESKVTVRVLQGHTEGVNSLAVYDSHIFSASDDGTVRRWEATLPYPQTIQLPSEYGVPDSVMITTPNGNSVVVKFGEEKWSQCLWSSGICSTPSLDDSQSKKLFSDSLHHLQEPDRFIPDNQHRTVKISREDAILHFVDVEKPAGEELFSLHLPKRPGEMTPDFDGRCTATANDCGIVVLFRDKLMWYKLKE